MNLARLKWEEIDGEQTKEAIVGLATRAGIGLHRRLAVGVQGTLMDIVEVIFGPGSRMKEGGKKRN